MSRTKTILIVEERIVERSTCFGENSSQDLSLKNQRGSLHIEIKITTIWELFPILFQIQYKIKQLHKIDHYHFEKQTLNDDILNSIMRFLLD